MKLSPAMLIVLPAAAVACFLAGRWTYAPVPKMESSAPGIYAHSSAADLAALHNKSRSLPFDDEAHERVREDIKTRIECGNAETIFTEIARKPKPDNYDNYDDSFIAHTALEEIFRRHGTEHAWKLALQARDEEDRIDYCLAVCWFLLKQDPEAALQKVESLPGAFEKNPSLDNAIATIAKTDPQRAADLVLHGKSGERLGSDIVKDIFFKLKRQDSEQARAALADLDDATRLRALKGYVSVLHDPEPATTWQVLAKYDIPVEDGYNSMHLNVLQSWIKYDPPAALAALLGIRETEKIQPKLFDELFASLVRQWGRKNFPAALDYVLQIDDIALSAKGLKALTDSDALRHPKADSRRLFDAIIEKMPQEKSLDDALSSLTSNWARRDPLAAIQAAKNLPPGEIQTDFASNVASYSAKTTNAQTLKAQIFDWIAAMPEGEMRKKCIESFFEGFAESDPRAALAMLATSQFSPEEQKTARHYVTWRWRRDDPKTAFEWIAKNLPEDEDRTWMLSEAIGNLANRSPAEALAVLQSHPALMQNMGAVTGLVNAWVDYDITAAERWTHTLPASSIKDEAITRVCEKLAPNHPQAALAAATTMFDGDKRTSCIWNIVAVWKHYDPTAATEWIEQNSPQKPEYIKEWDLPK